MALIGLCANWNARSGRSDIPADYVIAVILSGGTPVVLPLAGDERVWKKMIDAVDGLVFIGGGDVDPALFGEKRHRKTKNVVLHRDKQECWMMRYVKEKGKPHLAICRGMQVLNCLRGGTLYQDIAETYPTSINHSRSDAPADTIHEVTIMPSSLLGSVCGHEDLPVNSRHHQGVSRLGAGLAASAISEDKLVEALEYEDGSPCIAVQWHPETLHKDNPRHLAVFEWLVKTSEKLK
ncbi:MAG: gamma-glutamyl-gamma-aminobutyrate hydrolase family protein [Eubacteriales bacterium]|nr:gamma-glutamyl-gamma-aminobutyrate hydrolase family protein [Eubacteriales bacterium]